MKNPKLDNTRREIQMFFIKKLYIDAYYWHLIGKGYSPEQAEMAIDAAMKD